MTVHHLDSVNNSLCSRLFFHLLIYKLIDKILGAVDSIGSAGNLLVQWCGQLHVFLLRIIAACFGGIVG